MDIEEKIGIKLSKNYEEQSQVVNQSISDEKVDITLESIGIEILF